MGKDNELRIIFNGDVKFSGVMEDATFFTQSVQCLTGTRVKPYYKESILSGDTDQWDICILHSVMNYHPRKLLTPQQLTSLKLMDDFRTKVFAHSANTKSMSPEDLLVHVKQIHACCKHFAGNDDLSNRFIGEVIAKVKTLTAFEMEAACTQLFRRIISEIANVVAADGDSTRFALNDVERRFRDTLHSLRDEGLAALDRTVQSRHAHFREYMKTKSAGFIPRRWLEDEVVKALEGKSVGLSAEAGGGKTVFMSYLVSSAESQLKEQIVASYFCDVNTSWTLEPKPFVKYIVTMLLQRSAAYATKCLQTVEPGSVDLKDLTLNQQVLKLLHMDTEIDPLGLIKKYVSEPLRSMAVGDFAAPSSDNHSYYVIAVDSLDEALYYAYKPNGEFDVEKSIVRLVHFLVSDTGLPRWMRLVYTSRSFEIEESKEKRFKSMTFIDTQAGDNKVNTRSDVDSFISQRMIQLTTNPAVNGLAELDDDLMKTLSNSANGNFLFASLVIKDMELAANEFMKQPDDADWSNIPWSGFICDLPSGLITSVDGGDGYYAWRFKKNPIDGHFFNRDHFFGIYEVLQVLLEAKVSLSLEQIASVLNLDVLGNLRSACFRETWRGEGQQLMRKQVDPLDNSNKESKRYNVLATITVGICEGWRLGHGGSNYMHCRGEGQDQHGEG